MRCQRMGEARLRPEAAEDRDRPVPVQGDLGDGQQQRGEAGGEVRQLPRPGVGEGEPEPGRDDQPGGQGADQPGQKGSVERIESADPPRLLAEARSHHRSCPGPMQSKMAGGQDRDPET